MTTENPKPMSAELAECIERCGSMAKLAALCGISTQNIDQHWRARIPLAWLPAVEKATGIPKTRLRPDVFRVVVCGGLKDDELCDEMVRLAHELTEDDICRRDDAAMHKIVLLRHVVLRYFTGDRF